MLCPMQNYGFDYVRTCDLPGQLQVIEQLFLPACPPQSHHAPPGAWPRPPEFANVRNGSTDPSLVDLLMGPTSLEPSHTVVTELSSDCEFVSDIIAFRRYATDMRHRHRAHLFQVEQRRDLSLGRLMYPVHEPNPVDLRHNKP